MTMTDGYDLEETIVTRLGLFEDANSTEFLPLSEAVGVYVDFAKHPELRVWTGIRDIDAATRGIAPGELAVINGFAHNGKTVLVVEILIRNEGRTIVLFTPDETRTAVIAKLTAAIYGVSAEDLEKALLEGDPTAIEMLNTVAFRFRNLAVYDDAATLHGMDRAMQNVEAALGGKPACVIFDYADLLDEPLETNDKLKALKAWGKRQNIPMIVLHQSSRSGGAGGKEVTMTSGAYGGEQQATFLIGVRRKINFFKDQIRMLEEKLENTQNVTLAQKYAEKIDTITNHLIPRHLDTISISLLKNKRPPMRLVPEIDFRLEQETGRLIELGIPHGGLPDLPPKEPDPELEFPLTAKQQLAARRAPNNEDF
jgi:KaiC/GvpD/RAD55 family RecA-like ATPase